MPIHLVFQFRKVVLLPELVVCVSHLMSSEFRHEDFDNSNEDEEVDLKGEVKQFCKICPVQF